MREITITKIKNWLFPGIASLVGFLMWNTIQDIKSDISEVKADIKTLIASSNADHIRIESLERVVYAPKTTANAPYIPSEPVAKTTLAILTRKIELINEN